MIYLAPHRHSRQDDILALPWILLMLPVAGSLWILHVLEDCLDRLLDYFLDDQNELWEALPVMLVLPGFMVAAFWFSPFLIPAWLWRGWKWLEDPPPQ